MDRFRVGVVGCGKISGAYFRHARRFPILEMAACADLSPEAARAAAAQFGVPRVLEVEQLLNDPDLDCVLNLTIPSAHFPVSRRALEAGKHVYTEKPLCMTVAEGSELLQLAASQGLRVGSAPDTFLGAGHQTARAAVDRGEIGRPLSAFCLQMYPGPESFHPNPAFFYQPGAGPVFDMGPYYLTDLIQLLGAVDRVSAEAVVARSERTIAKGPDAGQSIPVDTPDHVSSSVRFVDGQVATLINSFAGHAMDIAPNITIFGEQGTMIVPDPNNFDGEVRVRRPGETEWRVLPTEHHMGYGRAAGLADMAHAIRAGRPHRASGELALGVLAVMEAALASAEQGRALSPEAKPSRPAALPVGLPEDGFEEE